MVESSLIAVVVTHNRLTKLRRCIRSYAKVPLDIILVVDNASTDGTAQWLQTECLRDTRIRVLRLDKNQGGAGGFQAGLRWADEQSEGRGWVLLHDDDAYPCPGTIEDFRGKQAHRCFVGFAGVAAAVLSPDGKAADVNRPILNPFRHPFYTLNRTLREARCIRDIYHVPCRDVEQHGNRYPIHAASFVGLFLNLEELPARTDWRYPNGGLFIYGDDTLYTARLHRSGHALLFDSDLRFVHATLTGYDHGIILPAWKNYYVSRNTLLVYQALSPWLGWLLYVIGICSRWLSLANYNDPVERRRVRRAMCLGVVDAVRGGFHRAHSSVLEGIERGSVKGKSRSVRHKIPGAGLK